MENKLKIVFATGNSHKLKEINDISRGSGIKFILPPQDFNPIEDGNTFEQNSFIKAKEASRLSKMISLADDSGLCVEALNGAPGIISARYDKTPQKRIEKLLKNLGQSDNRRAKFVCAMTLTDAQGNIITQKIGECRGTIAYKPVGENGFGYDPVFIPDGYEITIAQMIEELKNKISHRAIALNQMLSYIKQNIM